MYLRYLALVIPLPFVMVLNVLLSPILPLFIKAGKLPRRLSWFAPQDNPVWGDQAYHEREMKWANWMPYPLFLYVTSVCWMCRNAGYGYDYSMGVSVVKDYLITETGNTEANISRDENRIVTGTEGTYHRKLINGDGKEYFEYCTVFHRGNIWYRFQSGWHLHTIAAGRKNLKFTINRW